MSVTICLYRVIPDVTYTGTIYDKIPFERWFSQKDGSKKLEDYEKTCGAPDLLTEPSKYEEWMMFQFDNCWSDGKFHNNLQRYNVYTKQDIKKNRAYKRIMKRLDGFNWSYYPTADGVTLACLPVKEILHYQGWFFKKSFYKKKCTTCYCVSKDQINHFFDQYVTTTEYDNADSIRDMKKTILDTWEDGMILEISW